MTLLQSQSHAYTPSYLELPVRGSERARDNRESH